MPLPPCTPRSQSWTKPTCFEDARAYRAQRQLRILCRGCQLLRRLEVRSIQCPHRCPRLSILLEFQERSTRPKLEAIPCARERRAYVPGRGTTCDRSYRPLANNAVLQAKCPQNAHRRTPICEGGLQQIEADKSG